MRFWLGGVNVNIPDTLSVRVWSGNTAAGPDSSNATLFLYEQEIPAGNFSAGPNTIALDVPVEFTDTDEFCAGIFSGPLDDGVRVQTEFGTDGTKSYVQAPLCAPKTFALKPLSKLLSNPMHHQLLRLPILHSLLRLQQQVL